MGKILAEMSDFFTIVVTEITEHSRLVLFVYFVVNLLCGHSGRTVER